MRNQKEFRRAINNELIEDWKAEKTLLAMQGGAAKVKATKVVRAPNQTGPCAISGIIPDLKVVPNRFWNEPKSNDKIVREWARKQTATAVTLWEIILRNLRMFSLLWTTESISATRHSCGKQNSDPSAAPILENGLRFSVSAAESISAAKRTPKTTATVES